MSWDVMMVKTANNCEPMEEIDETNSVPFDVGAVAAVIKKKFNIGDNESDEWLVYEGDTYAISFSVTQESVMLFISILDEPEDAVIPAIKELCDLLDCRAFDTTTAEFI